MGVSLLIEKKIIG